MSFHSRERVRVLGNPLSERSMQIEYSTGMSVEESSFRRGGLLLFVVGRTHLRSPHLSTEVVQTKKHFVLLIGTSVRG